MEKRKFGRTGHLSSVAILGGAVFWDVDQAAADSVFELCLQEGINHIDIAPSYGKAETLAGPWIKRIRSDIFLSCKTMEREGSDTWQEMHSSFERLQTDHFDLYQCHAVTDLKELDKVTKKNGALASMVKARSQGLIDFIGITTHGLQAPVVLLEALSRFDFDTILFPINPILFGDSLYRQAAMQLIDRCQKQDVGMMIIKSIARGSWGNHEKTHATWYEPFTNTDRIRNAVDFALSFPITGICMAGDVSLIPKLISACDDFHQLDENEKERLIEDFRQYRKEPLFE